MRRKVTRRDFMKGAAIVAASGLLAGCSGGEGPAAPDNSEQPGTSEKPAESNSNSSSSSESESTSSSKPEKTNGIKWTYSKNSDGTITLKGYDKNAEKVPSGELIIPEKYGTRSVRWGINVCTKTMISKVWLFPIVFRQLDNRPFANVRI